MRLGLFLLSIISFAKVFASESPAIQEWVGSYAVVGEAKCQAKGGVREKCDITGVAVSKEHGQLKITVNRKDNSSETWVNESNLTFTCGKVLQKHPDFVASANSLCREDIWDEHGGYYIETRLKLENLNGSIFLRQYKKGNTGVPWSLDILLELTPVGMSVSDEFHSEQVGGDPSEGLRAFVLSNLSDIEQKTQSALVRNVKLSKSVECLGLHGHIAYRRFVGTCLVKGNLGSPNSSAIFQVSIFEVGGEKGLFYRFALINHEDLEPAG